MCGGAYHERERLCPEGVRVREIDSTCTLRCIPSRLDLDEGRNPRGARGVRDFGQARFGHHIHIYTIAVCKYIYTNVFASLMPKKVGPPPHATWYVRRVSLPPALQALTCRLGAPARPWNERAFSYAGRCR